MRQISMSRTAFEAVLHLLRCGGKNLLPKAERGVDMFLRGRDELCQSGWCELDFDGSLMPEPDFMRMIYALAHPSAVVRLEQTGKTQWVLYTPVELLFVTQTGESVCLARNSKKTLLPWMRESVMSARDGCLTTRRDGTQRRTELSGSDPKRAEELAGHLCLFYGKEENGCPIL